MQAILVFANTLLFFLSPLNVFFLKISPIFRFFRIDPLHSNRWICNPDVRNLATEEITICDWLYNYENDDVSHKLPPIDFNLQNL